MVLKTKATIQEDAFIIQSPTIVKLENGFYLFNRDKESKVFLKVEDVIADVQAHLEKQMNELAIELSKNAKS